MIILVAKNLAFEIIIILNHINKLGMSACTKEIEHWGPTKKQIRKIIISAISIIAFITIGLIIWA